MHAELSWWLFLFMPIAVFFACYLFHGGAAWDRDSDKPSWPNLLFFGVPLFIYLALVIYNWTKGN